MPAGSNAVRMAAIRYVNDAFPGFVECALVDVHGAVWTFIEKVPVVSLADLDARSTYPQPVTVACAVVATRRDPDGREVVTIDTSVPWGIAASSGETRFEVGAEQLTASDEPTG
ncbi:MAG: hypothetical protein K8W52_38910 [Deltaproteobacteria bacterium]|nr:hypothetical protein [Deltaproteobacteria bacterium]